MDVFAQIKSVGTLQNFLDLSQLPAFLSAGAPLLNADLSSYEGTQVAVQLALNLVCPFTAMTKTTLDDRVCPLAQFVAERTLLVSAAAAVVYGVFRRRSDNHQVSAADVESLVDAVKAELQNDPNAPDSEARPRSLLFNPTTVLTAVQLVIELINLFRSGKLTQAV
jgi:hypothetical protein